MNGLVGFNWVRSEASARASDFFPPRKALQLGRTHDALASYREALDFSLDHAGKGRALLGVAAALRIMDRHEEALDALDRAEAALAEDDDLRAKARLYTLRGNLCFPLGRVDACLCAHERALDFARSANSHADIARRRTIKKFSIFFSAPLL